MKKVILLIALSVCTASLWSQALNKIVASKHGNGKPELVYYYQGASNPENLVKQERFSVDGKKTMEKNYVAGKLHGAVSEWKEFDGTLVSELKYEAGLLSGKQLYYFSDGKPKLELNYTAGKLEGRQVEYWFKKPADSLKSEHNYSGGIPHGMQRQWTKEGKPVYNLNFQAGKPEGIQRTWTEAGEQKEEKWKAGMFEEPLKNWTAAQPRHVKSYNYQPAGDSLNLKLGRTLQREVWYYETGAIEAITTVGTEPETQVFYLSGKPMAKGKGTFEQREGRWEFLHQNGKKMMSGEYKAGKQVGLFERWDEGGRLVSEEFWNPNGTGRETWKVFAYYPAGSKESEGTLEADGRRKGKWKYWYENGNKKREEEWGNSCPGKNAHPYLQALSAWDESGRLVSRGDEKNQQQITYFANGNAQFVTSVRFVGRDACSTGPVEQYKEGTFNQTVPPPADFAKAVTIEKISFFENGDTMRIDRWDDEGKRSGYQQGWYADAKPQYAYHYQKGLVQGSVKEWYPTGQPMLDHKYSTVPGGTPSLQQGTYYSDKAKEYTYDISEGKKKKVMEEIDAISHFAKFWQENK